VVGSVRQRGTVYLGTYEHSIDGKGRLFLPSKLRAGSGDTTGAFIVTRGWESCLYVYDAKTFHETVAGKLQSLPVKNQEDGRAFKRLLLAGAQDVALDDMGRLLVPKPLAEHAGLKKDVAILGVGERIELWDAGRWRAYSKTAAGKFQRLGKDLEI
jgi:MraZ protein